MAVTEPFVMLEGSSYYTLYAFALFLFAGQYSVNSKTAQVLLAKFRSHPYANFAFEKLTSLASLKKLRYALKQDYNNLAYK